jgi:hypothetical protein
MQRKRVLWLDHPDILMEIRERLVRVEVKLDNHNGIRERVDSVEDRAIENDAMGKSNCKRIDKLEENNTWLWRTIVGAIIVAAVGALAIFR